MQGRPRRRHARALRPRRPPSAAATSADARPAVERVHPPDALIRIANPVVRCLLTSPLHPLVSGQLLLLRFSGRRTGRQIELPVGRREFDGRPAVYTNSRWRHNFRGGRDAELVVAGEPRPVRGELVEDVATVAGVYAAEFDALGWKAAQRRLGLRVNAGRAPTRAELEQAIASSGLSIVVFESR